MDQRKPRFQLIGGHQHAHHDHDHHQEGHTHHDHDHNHHHDAHAHDDHDHDHHHHHDHEHHHGHDQEHHHDHDHHHDHGDEYGHEYDMYPKEFVRLYQSPHFEGHIIDVREEWEFHKVKLLGSVSIPLRHLPERLDSLRPSEMYYIICSQGIRSSFAAEYLLESGYTDLRVIQTGIFGLCEYVEHEFGTVPWIIKE